MNYISIIIAAVILLTVAASAVAAFIIRKNWASITMLVSILLFAIFIAGQIYLQSRMYERAYSNDIEHIVSYQKEREVLKYLGYFSIPLFMISLTGFISSTASIYKKSVELQRENQQLSNKLNQL